MTASQTDKVARFRALHAAPKVFVSANASDPDGAITLVEFYANDKLIGSKATLPYFFQWIPSCTLPSRQWPIERSSA